MPTVIDLSALGTAGFIIRGDSAYDGAGFVSDAGDINGDGFADLIVGAPAGDDGGANAGEAYVIFGKARGFGTIDLSNLARKDGFVIQGDAAGDRLGAGGTVSGAGDVNGDGFADLIVGAVRGDDGGVGAGEAYVIFGKADGFRRIDLTNLTPEDGFVIQGDVAGDYAGNVSGAGDVNGDGFADLIVGASGGDHGGTDAGDAYVIFGKASGFGRIDLSALVPSDGFVIQGDAAGDDMGSSVSGAGDVNGDGFDDLIVGAFGGDDGGTNAGEAYVIFGKADGFERIDLTALAPSDGFVIQGDSAGDAAGVSVSGAGDVNGDGFADLIIGAYGGDDGGGEAGEAYVIFGKARGFGRIDLTALEPVNGFVIQGDRPEAYAGFSVSGAGDVNGDGFADLIVGALGGGGGIYAAGAAYVIFGKASGHGRIDLDALAPTDGFIIQGDAAGDSAGVSVSGAGDVNGDGFDDVIIGASRGDDGGRDAGEAYVIFGVAPTESVTRIGSEIGQTIRGGLGNDTLDGRDGDDTLIAAGGSDALIGGKGRDALDGGSGNDRLNGGVGNDVLAGGSGKDVLSGGSGADQFYFGAGDSVARDNRADRITDFSQAEQDLIDLTDFDAIAGTPATEAFTFIGTAAFSGAAGELRYRFSGGDTLVSGDTDGDGAADLTIRLDGQIALVTTDFALGGGGAGFVARDADADPLPAHDFAVLRSGDTPGIVADLML